MDGDYVQTSEGTLLVDVKRRGKKPLEFDQLVVTGDATQVDVPNGKSGIAGLERTLAGIDDLAFVRLHGSDVVRHKIVADIVAAYEQSDADPG